MFSEKDIEYRVTVSIPCFGRPGRTRRLLERLEAQTVDNFEIFMIGDNCEHFEELLNSIQFNEWKQRMSNRNVNIISFNFDEHYGGFGYMATNYAIENASGKYFIFVDNDDIIENDHIEFYLSEIENTDYDMVYYNCFVRPYGIHRESDLSPGFIGHSEVIVKTEKARLAPKHSSVYGHDWEFASYFKNLKTKKTENPFKFTYYISAVTHMDGCRFDADAPFD